jgi:hypothetical protein
MLQSLQHRGRTRGLLLLAPALALIAVLLPAVAGTVIGHHATVTAQLDCNGSVTYKVYDWTTNNANHQAEATLTISYQVNGTGSWTSLGTIAFTSSNYVTATNNGIAGTPFNPGEVTSVTIRAVIANWVDGGAGGTYTATATRPTNCGKRSPSIATVASPNTGTIGVAMTAGDTGTVTGGFAMNGQTVRFRLYNNSSCSSSSGGLILDTGSSGVAISGGVATWSANWTPTAIGTYYWRASYGGNTYNNSFDVCGGANETVVIGKASPSIATNANPTTGTVGVAVTAGDTGTVTGGYNMNGQTVRFGLYASANCSTAEIIGGNRTISSGSASFSTSWTPSATGTYYWKVSYAGNSTNNSFSACGGVNETLTIGPKSPSITTVASPNTGTVGVAITAGDTATVTGGYALDGQTVAFSLFDNANCSGSAIIGGNGTISSGVASFSTSWTPQAAGTYYWKVNFAGNGNNNSFSACGGANETVVIGPASPSITTVASPSTGTVGTAMTAGDTATVTGGFGLDGQTVAFGLYDNANCSGSAIIGGNGTIASGIATFSTSWTPQAMGTYYWKVNYAGNGNNNSFSACGGANETVVIGSASPSITTVASPNTGTVGTAVTAGDTATVNGGFGLDGQTVAFGLYDNADCSGSAIIGGNGIIASGSASFSAAWTPSAIGTYYWKVSYAGDNSNAPYSECGGANETIVINQAGPSIATVLSETSGSIGDTVHDTATLTGATADAGGTVTYTVFTNATCDAGAIGAGTKTVTNGVIPNSDNIQFNSAGTWYWQAVYSGDANNAGATSPCTEEVLTIGQAGPSITTVLSATTAAVGDTVHDTATLHGATADAAGTVTYTVFSNSTCESKYADAGVVDVTNGIVPNSNGIQFNSVGTWYWQAVYSGDANNAGATSACIEEQLTVKASPSASASEDIGGETGTPDATTPPTSTGNGPGNTGAPLMALLIALAFGSLGLMAVEVQRRRINR